MEVAITLLVLAVIGLLVLAGYYKLQLAVLQTQHEILKQSLKVYDELTESIAQDLEEANRKVTVYEFQLNKEFERQEQSIVDWDWDDFTDKNCICDECIDEVIEWVPDEEISSDDN